MGKIILVPLGHCEHNVLHIFNRLNDPDLSDKGMMNTQYLGVVLSESFKIAHIFCSPKKRSKTMARIIRQFFRNAEVKALDFILEAKATDSCSMLFERAKEVYPQMMKEVTKLPSHEDVLFIGDAILFRMVEAVHRKVGHWEEVRKIPWWDVSDSRVLEKPE